MDYVLKAILNSEWTLLIETTMTLRKIFESKRTKKEGEEKNSSWAQTKRGRREKSFFYNL